MTSAVSTLFRGPIIVPLSMSLSIKHVKNKRAGCQDTNTRMHVRTAKQFLVTQWQCPDDARKRVEMV